MMECEICLLTMIPVLDAYNGKYSWAKYFVCHHCNHHACICVMCPQASIMYSKKNIYNHNGYHNSKKFNACRKRDIDQVPAPNIQNHYVSFDNNNDDVDLLNIMIEANSTIIIQLI